MIAGADVPVTYSRFSQSAVERDMGIHIPFIPISHDPTIYTPGSKAASRARLNLPLDKFIVGMVATNQYRKLWGEFFEAGGALARRHDDVLLLPWTTWNLQMLGGFDIEDLVYRNAVDRQTINPAEHIGQLNDSQMADLYRALDVCVLTTVGEGAGLPPIRARACGTPALVSDNTSNSEFAADPFELIPSRVTHLDNGSNIARFSTDTHVLLERLEELYKDRSLLGNLGERCAQAMLPYATPNVLPQWDRLLESI
jgi:glycosyltransferase involved in cell wall biosynthesis